MEFISLWTICSICIITINGRTFNKYGITPQHIETNSNNDQQILGKTSWPYNNQKQMETERLDPQKIEELNHLFRGLHRNIYRERRKFPEIDAKGFDEDVFDEGFGDFSTMKKRNF